MKQLTKSILIAFTIFSSTAAYSQVGIGTTNPQQFFHVDGANNNPTSGAPSAAQSTDDFVVTASGRVGIGTTSPQQQLHTTIAMRAGNFGSTGYTDLVAGDATNSGYISFNLQNSTRLGYIGYNGTNMTYYGDNGANHIFTGNTTSNGRVGIGTASPTTSLHVNGSFRLSDGTQQSGRVLTSDTNGVGTWQALSSGNKTALIFFNGNQNFSTNSFTNFSGTPTIVSNEIGASASATNIFLTAGKYLVVISSDLSAGEYGIYRVLRGDNNAVLFTSYYGEWLNASFLLDITAGDTSIYFQFQGLLTNPSSGYYRNSYSNVGWGKQVTILKLN